MRNKELLWFRLFNTNGFGTKSIYYIFDILQCKSQTIEDLYAFDEKEFNEVFPDLGIGKFSKATFSNLHQTEGDDKLYLTFEALEDKGVRIIGLDDERYPKRVLRILKDNSPVVLFCKGNLKLLNNKSISIVGAREIDNTVISLTNKIAEYLANGGYNVTSGYAKGVDTSAHIGALEADGTTTMILSFGVNYISVKRELKEFDLDKNGLFITQFAPYEKFTGQNAMTRNKLVCAMSNAIVVMQSGPERNSEGKMSGTFDAGKSAIEFGIPLFVLSPKIIPNAKGNQDLIHHGGIEFDNGTQITEYLEKGKKKETESNLLNNALPQQRPNNSIQLKLEFRF